MDSRDMGSGRLPLGFWQIASCVGSGRDDDYVRIFRSWCEIKSTSTCCVRSCSLCWAHAPRGWWCSSCQLACATGEDRRRLRADTPIRQAPLARHCLRPGAMRAATFQGARSPSPHLETVISNSKQFTAETACSHGIDSDRSRPGAPKAQVHRT